MTSGTTLRPPQRTIPGWLAPLSLTWCVLGIGVSAYLTFEHYTGSTTLACPASGAVDCAKVTSSAWSTILGIPVAPLGLVFFVVMLILCRPSLLRRRSATLDAVRLGLCGVGLLMALYLLWAELFRIHALCLWCTGVHLLTFALFVTLLFGLVLSEPERERMTS